MNPIRENRRWPSVAIPLLMVLLLSWGVRAFDLDIRMADLFFDETTGQWLLKDTPAERLLFRIAPIPALVLFGIAVIAALGSIWRRAWRRWTRGAVFWILVVALGPGIVVNAIFKDGYGRSRPAMVTHYGGDHPFLPVWVPGKPGDGMSFPSGHAAMGFCFMAGYFYWWRRNGRRARGWLAGGLAAGSFIGLVRMAVGGHWFTDVLWSGVFVYFVSYALAVACGLLRTSSANEALS